MAQFTTGVIVKLKSGGPNMTCQENPSADGRIWCQWFAGNKLERGRFPLNSLVITDESEKKKKK